MKRWTPPAVAEKPIEKVIEKPIETKIEAVAKAVPFSFKCIFCLRISEVLFNGTSYCEPCLREKLRVGK